MTLDKPKQESNLYNKYGMSFFNKEVVHRASLELMITSKQSDVEKIVENVFNNIGLSGFYKLKNNIDESIHIFGSVPGYSFAKKIIDFIQNDNENNTSKFENGLLFRKSRSIFYLVDTNGISKENSDNLHQQIDKFICDIEEWFSVFGKQNATTRIKNLARLSG